MKESAFTGRCHSLVDLCERAEIILNDCLEKEMEEDKSALQCQNTALIELICTLSVLKFASSLLVYYTNRGRSLLLKQLKFMEATADKFISQINNIGGSTKFHPDALEFIKDKAILIKDVIGDIIRDVKDDKPHRYGITQ